MIDREKVHSFALKWCNKFRNQKTNYTELVSKDMADDCNRLGFKMDKGYAFYEKYGDAVHDYEELDKIIDDINDIGILGSAIYSRWRYFNHWAYASKEILKFENRGWFILALSRLIILSKAKPFTFKGEAQTIRITSNNICYGPCPEPMDEVEQHLTINAKGQVEFLCFNYGLGIEQYEQGRSIELNIEKPVADKILNTISEYFNQGYDEIFVTDIGVWRMEITNTDGNSHHFKGSLSEDFEINGINLSDLIRDEIDIDNLYVFDGNYKPDKVNKINIEYSRKTKIKPEELINETEEYVTLTWNYTEQLIIDRNAESIEHIQDIGIGCVSTRKFQFDGRIEKLLDDLDAESLFNSIEGNPPDVIENPNEIKDYKIIIDFERGKQRTITGTYDKKGLPTDWTDFAENVLEIILSYGLGEILVPSVYNMIRRCKSDYIYCSVTFDESYKTYYYITDDDSIEIGDFVIVPVGKDNKQAVVEVVNIEYFSEENVPLSLDKTKKVIRKCEDEDLE